MKSLAIVGIGSYLPPDILSNADLEKMVDTSDEWIVSRTGIRERRIAKPGVASSDLALEAAKNALKDARLEPDELDLIIFSTAFPDYGSNEPRTAEVFKLKLGARNALSLEEPAECAGFDFSLVRALEEAQTYGYKRILVACGDKTTAFVNKQDRQTVVLFGDGGGAVVLKPCGPRQGILSSYRQTYPYATVWSKTPAIEWIYVPAGGSRLPANTETVERGQHYMVMTDGGAILRYVTEEIPRVCETVCKRADVDIHDVKYIVPHSANSRIIQSVERRLGLKSGIVLDNAERVGNTSCSSVPIGLDRLYKEGKLSWGDLVITVGFGAGIVIGANLIRWTKSSIVCEEGGDKG